MLILSRRSGQKILVGEGENRVVLTVTEISGEKVKIGFEANREVPILRDELNTERTEEPSKGN